MAHYKQDIPATEFETNQKIKLINTQRCYLRKIIKNLK